MRFHIHFAVGLQVKSWSCLLQVIIILSLNYWNITLTCVLPFGISVLSFGTDFPRDQFYHAGLCSIVDVLSSSAWCRSPSRTWPSLYYFLQFLTWILYSSQAVSPLLPIWWVLSVLQLKLLVKLNHIWSFFFSAYPEPSSAGSPLFWILHKNLPNYSHP